MGDLQELFVKTRQATRSSREPRREWKAWTGIRLKDHRERMEDVLKKKTKNDNRRKSQSHGLRATPLESTLRALFRRRAAHSDDARG